MPKLSDKILLGELPIEKYVTHEFDGIDKIQELVDNMRSGECLRGVLKIGKYEAPQTLKIKVLASHKTFGGAIKKVQHWSNVNQCDMTFQIFVPQDEVTHQRCDPYSVIYHLSGLTCDWTNAVDKSGYA